MSFNFTDFYIGYPGHPRFKESALIEDDVVRVIVQKYEMILFTNKGDVFGDPNFGANLEELLHETKLSAETIENEINGQIASYIAEIKGLDYTLTVSFFDDPERHQQYMEIYFQIKEYEVLTLVG